MLLLVLSAGALLAHAGAVSVIDVQDLVSRADEIVVGYVTDLHEVRQTTITDNGRSVAATEMQAHVSVERVIKGHASEQINVNFLITRREFIGYRGIPRASRRVLFLKQNGSSMEPVSPYYPSLPASDPKDEPKNLSTTDEVVTTVAAVLYPPYGEVTIREEALWLLGFMCSAICEDPFRTAASQDPDPKMRLNAVAYLLRRGDLSFFPIAARVLQNPASSGITVPSRLDEVEQNLSSAIAAGVRNDPKAIPLLTDLLSSSDVRVRRAAVHALGNSGSGNAARSLLTGLRDADDLVRYQAAVGLAQITGQSNWRPLREEFQEDEAKYIQHWEEWASRTQTE